MKTEPITAAAIEFDTEGVPHAPAFGDRYHARAGAMAQAEHVFLGGNGLPRRWAGRERFVVLETGFGLGVNFLATWAAWRREAARPARLHFVSIDKHPPRREDLARVHAALADEALPRDLAAALRAAWPPLTGDLHRLAFEQGRVELLLAFGDAAAWLRKLQLQADAIFLDGFAPERNAAMWSEAVFAALPALCASGATAATWSVARPVAEGLAANGFEVERAPGFAGKREMTVARFAPRHRPARTGRRQAAMPSARSAIVVGAGLAGAAAAAALCEQGLDVTVLEARPEASVEAAGAGTGAPASALAGPLANALAGLVRGIVARDDGAHARWHRAAALQAQRQIAAMIAADAADVGHSPAASTIASVFASAGTSASGSANPSTLGRLEGVLHLADDFADMRRRAATAAWPSDYVQPLDAAAASARAGLALSSPAWLFAGGGWVDPIALIARTLASSGALVRRGCAVATLQRRGSRWLAFGPQGQPWAEADLVVLANAHGAAALAPLHAVAAWKTGRSRGQVTVVPADALRSLPGDPHPPLPHLPLARSGYVIPLPDGSVLCGATNSPGDGEPLLRASDHAHNLGVLKRLAGIEAAVDARHLGGRVGWRCHSDDRLPLIGALAADLAEMSGGSGSRFVQPRHVPRESGLFALTALGSRGITSAALGARVLAAWVCEAPMPVDTDLLDAVDAARHLSRSLARGAGRPRFDARADAHAGPHPSPLLPHEGAILRPARAGEGDP